MFEAEARKPSLTSAVDWINVKRCQGQPTWLSVVKQKGRHRFEEMGLPHQRLEEWKYTDVSIISQQPFAPPTPVDKEIQASLKGSSILDQGLSPLQLVFVNGFYSPLLSRQNALPSGVEIRSLAEVIKQNNPLLEKHLAAYANEEESSFVALNNAYIEDGAFIYIPQGIHLKDPIHLIYINLEKDMPHVFYPRNMIVVDEGARVEIVEDYIGDVDASYLTNGVTEIVVKTRATVNHYKLQRESEEAFHIAFIQVLQEKDSRFSSNSITLGGQLTRNNIHSRMTGSGAACIFNGIYLVQGNQHVDNHTRIDHVSPDCRSEEVYHGILHNRAKGVFNGKIYVHPQAQKTDSRQTSRSLLLSREAVVKAKPQLEIFADDVKCSHGAAVGQIDADSLYYLRCRGLADRDARKILTLAFARQVTDRIELEAFRWKLKNLLVNRLDQWNWEVK